MGHTPTHARRETNRQTDSRQREKEIGGDRRRKRGTMNDDRFDGLFLNVAQSSDTGIDGMLTSFFGFLARKTDFFDGPAEETLIRVFRRIDKEYKRQKREDGDDEPEPISLAESQKKNRTTVSEIKEEPKKKSAQAPQKNNKPSVIEAAKEDAEKRAQRVRQEAEKEKAERLKKKLEAESKGEEPPADDDDDAEAEGKQVPNSGNGGVTDIYVWNQTLQEVDVKIPIEADFKVRSRDLSIQFTKTKVKVGLKGKPMMIDGEWHKAIKVDDTFWTLENNTVTFSIAKLNDMEWWAAVVKGDDEIDTKKVEPENSKLSDLDGETRGMVEKMMFDQRQKAAGLPSSDDLKKAEMMEKFKAAHPEMDFSQVQDKMM